MKSLRFLKPIAAIIVIVASAFPSLAESFEVDGLLYEILPEFDKTVRIIASDETKTCTSLIIPSTVTYSDNTYSVTSIDRNTFEDNTNLISVTIPASVTEIGFGAFSGCRGLKEVHITDIAAWCNIVFDYLSYNSNPLYYAKNLYLNGVLVTDLVIPDTVPAIYGYVFINCECLTSVTIPDSVYWIGERAFCGCTGLTSITIPDSVHSIGEGAFSSCKSLTSVTIPDSVIWIGRWAFECCTGLTSITIPNSVTEIGHDAFRNCTGLTSVTISDSVTKISDSAFFGCAGLTSITIPNSVTKIESCAFWGCTSLTSVTIPDSVTEIMGNAFIDCVSLKEVHITDIAAWCNIDFGNNPLYYAKNLYLNGDLVTDLVIPETVTAIKRDVFRNCECLVSVTIPDSVTKIWNGAFSGCVGLKEVHITDIAAWCNIDFGNNPLYYAKNLYLNGDLVTDLVIPDTVTAIKGYVFENCECLASVKIPKSVTSIGGAAFLGCVNLRHVYYDAKNISSVGPEIFNCSSITNIIFGKDVQSIPNGIFDNCQNVKVIVSKNSIPPVCEAGAFALVDKSKCVLYVPSASHSSASYLYVPSANSLDYCSADIWKDFATIKTFYEVSALSLRDSNFTVKTNEYLQLEATIMPVDASIKDLIWKSSNPEIAIVSDTGQVQGRAPGEATITAMTIDGSNLKATCYVTVSDSSGVECIETVGCTVTVENGAIVVKNAVGEVAVHNLTGVAVALEHAYGATLRIDGLQHGVYIVTVNGKATKVVL